MASCSVIILELICGALVVAWPSRQENKCPTNSILQRSSCLGNCLYRGRGHIYLFVVPILPPASPDLPDTRLPFDDLWRDTARLGEWASVPQSIWQMSSRCQRCRGHLQQLINAADQALYQSQGKRAQSGGIGAHRQSSLPPLSFSPVCRLPFTSSQTGVIAVSPTKLRHNVPTQCPSA